jgi:hypothetical protein
MAPSNWICRNDFPWQRPMTRARVWRWARSCTRYFAAGDSFVLTGPMWELPGTADQPAPEAPRREDDAVSVLPALGEKSHNAAIPEAGLGSWPIALRHVCAWLEPGLMLWHYWRAWSAKPPPPALQRLLDWLWKGRGIELYIQQQQTTTMWPSSPSHPGLPLQSGGLAPRDDVSSSPPSGFKIGSGRPGRTA